MVTPRVTNAISRKRWESVSKRKSISSLKIFLSNLNVTLVPVLPSLILPVAWTGALG